MNTTQPEADCAVETIEHQGIVTQLDEIYYYVSIVAESACSACSVKGACNVTDLKEELVEIPRKDTREQKIGDRVILYMQKSLGTKAVLLGYVFPFLLLLFTLIVSINIFNDEGLAGLLALGILIPYYLLLYWLKDMLKQTFVFKIRS